MKNIVFVFGLLAVLLSMQVQAAAGRFQFVSGDVKVTSAAGKERVAHKGDEVNEGESITSSSAASAQVKMRDDGLIIVRPDTKLRITTFQFNGKADGSERSLITLVKGGFRALTGMIGSLHKDTYMIETPTATIGIRGTDHEPMFIPNPAPGHVALAEPGTYDKVNSGAAVLSTARGMIVINPNHAGFVPNIVNAAPIVLSVIPKFYLPPSKDEPAIVPSASLQPVGTQAGTTTNTGSSSTGTTAVTTVTTMPTKSLTVAPSTMTLSTTAIAPTTSTLSTAVIAPVVDTTTITKTAISPAATTSTLSTAVIAPVVDTTIITKTAISPAVTTSTLSTAVIAPAPSTSTAVIAPATIVAPAPVTKQFTAPSVMVSDRRLKMNIKRIGTHNLGIGIYEFDYIWGQHAIGVMADEVKLVRPEAVLRDKSGYDMVDYSKLN